MLVDAETKALLRDLIVELRKMRETLEKFNEGDTMRVEYDFSKGVRGKYLDSVKKATAKCDCKIEDFCPKCMPNGIKPEITRPRKVRKR